jgi:hypothetical protein
LIMQKPPAKAAFTFLKGKMTQFSNLYCISYYLRPSKMIKVSQMVKSRDDLHNGR